MKKLIVTVGPALLKHSLLETLDSSNHIYRINGAHAEIDSLGEITTLIRKSIENPKILLDLSGNKIRTTNLDKPLSVTKGKKINFNPSFTNYPKFYQNININDNVYADDSTLHFTVKSIDKNNIELLSHSSGYLKPNKGLHIRGIHKNIPFLFEKDLEMIDVANTFDIDFIGLSFVRSVDDIIIAKKLINNNIEIISKVETAAAVENIDSILENIDNILIDRGDLSTEVGIENVPYFQNYIIDKALFHNKHVFLATQFLKNMENNPIPTIAEIIDLYNTFKKGVYGIQLSEETAIGKYPIECIEYIEKILSIIQKEKSTKQLL